MARYSPVRRPIAADASSIYSSDSMPSPITSLPVPDIDSSDSTTAALRIPVPADLQPVLTAAFITVPEATCSWSVRTTKPWHALAASSKAGYWSQAKNAVAAVMGHAETDFRDPVQLILPVIQADRIWSLVRYAAAQSIDKRNAVASGILACANELLRHLIRSGETDTQLYSRTVQASFVLHALTRAAIGVTLQKMNSQVPQQGAQLHTVPWPAWTAAAHDYIAAAFTSRGTVRRGVTVVAARNACIVGCYSLMPPTRLQWHSVRIGVTHDSVTAARQNVLLLNPRHPTVVFSDFKNAASMGQVELPLPKRLAAILRSYLAARAAEGLHSQWLFPAAKADACMSNGAFGSLLASVAEQLTGRRFSVRLMRSSFIRDWHDKHPKATNQEVLALMVNLLQTNLAVHLAYKKVLA